MKLRTGIGITLGFALAHSAFASLLPQQDFRSIPGVRTLSGSLLVKPKQTIFSKGFALAMLAPISTRTLRGVGIYVVPVPAGRSDRGYASELMESGVFEYALPNWRCFPDRIPNDPKLNLQWHHTKIESPRAWDIRTGTSGDPIVIAVCDTGIDVAHPDFAGGLVSGYNAVTRTAQSDGGNVSDTATFPHGTFVSGCAAAQADNAIGVAGIGWNFKIMPIRISTIATGSAEGDDILDGMMWAAAHGAKIVNVSYSGLDQARQDTAAFV